MSSAPSPSSPHLTRLGLRLVEPGRGSNLRELARRRTRDDELERLRMFAAIRRAPPVFCAWSAALIHGLPLLHAPPRTIHVLAAGTTENAWNGVVTHVRLDDAVTEVRGLHATGIPRTVADLAGRTSFVGGVALADATLATGPFGERTPLTTRAALHAAAERLPDPSARRRALAVAAFADGRAESILESVSRATLALAGAPPPQLQVPLTDLTGFHARLDFAWPALSLAGEADGATKHIHPAHLRGRTPAESLAAQTARERRIEGMGFRVMRWNWETARRVDRMTDLLRAYGVPLGEGDGVLR